MNNSKIIPVVTCFLVSSLWNGIQGMENYGPDERTATEINRNLTLKIEKEENNIQWYDKLDKNSLGSVSLVVGGIGYYFDVASAVTPNWIAEKIENPMSHPSSLNYLVEISLPYVAGLVSIVAISSVIVNPIHNYCISNARIHRDQKRELENALRLINQKNS